MLRAIIVEDSDDDTELLRRELVRGGFELVFERVQTAPDLEAAIRHGEWDIIFSDWTMPQFSAPRALEVVKQQELDIPFIIVSGTIGEDVAVEALRSGANDFFPKNRLTLLVPAIERELREAALRRERAQMQEQLVISDRMASIGILAAGIAHEINNPLTAVIGNLDLAIRAFAGLKTSDGPDGRRLGEISALRAVEDEVRHAHEGAQRIRNVVRDVKLFARSGSEEHAAVDVRRVVDSSLRMAGNENPSPSTAPHGLRAGATGRGQRVQAWAGRFELDHERRPVDPRRTGYRQRDLDSDDGGRRRASRSRGARQRCRHVARGEKEPLHALFHDQASRGRHWARVVDLPADHQLHGRFDHRR